jgi:uncharacterized coiled-coil protein SlyX
MEYPLVSALVPEGENFDSSAVNEGVWVTQAHLVGIENALTENNSAIANHASELQALGGQVTSTNEALTAANASLATANETVAAKDQEIATLQAKITELENKTEDPKQSSKPKDETGGSKTPWENPMNKLADSLLGTPKVAKKEGE